jgi:diacylglycerol kinase (ATP)
MFILPEAFYFGKTSIEIVVLCFSWFLVLFFEIINNWNRKRNDLFGGEIHPILKKAKDIASGSVFLAIFVWLIVLI